MGRNDVYTTRACKSCNQLFNITYGEKAFYESKGMNLPTHCEQHRGQVRASIPLRSAPPPPPRPSQPRYTPPPSPAKSSGCLIAALPILGIPVVLIAAICFAIFR